MNKNILAVAWLLLLLPAAFASESWIYNSKSLDMTVSIDSSLTASAQKTEYSLSYVNADLYFYPRSNFMQSVYSIDTQPKAEKDDDFYHFGWDSPSPGTYKYSLDSQVNVLNSIVQIKSKVDFPLKSIPDEYTVYVQPTENIDSDNYTIIEKASELAQGENDLYVVLFKLSDWINTNVNYDLNSLTASVTQKPSWVLKNKEGVCDEITSLFVAMSRSLGIPARYISGVAYTNYNSINNWGPHAWAEVYFPGYGWVPYDVTYGQFGYVDPSHIILKVSSDSSEASTKFKWLGNNVDVQAEPLKIKVKLDNAKGTEELPIEIKTTVINKEVGFGSYNLVEASIKNLKDYYVATELSISKSEGMEAVSQSRNRVWLGPGQEKKVYWIISVDNNLNKDSIYTFYVGAYSSSNASSVDSFKASFHGEVHTLSEMKQLMDDMMETGQKVYSSSISIDCKPTKKEIYSYEEVDVNCTITNSGNSLLKSLRVCLDESCKVMSIGITQSKDIAFSLGKLDAGNTEKIITASNAEISKTKILNLNILDVPQVEISNIEFPASVSYGQNYSLKFLLDIVSRSLPKNVNITLKTNGEEQSWWVGDMSSDKPFEIKLSSKDMNIGSNAFTIKANYKDANGKGYSTETSINISLENVSFTQRIVIYFRMFGRWVSNLF